MYLSALRLFKSLSSYHYRTIILTMLLPVIGPPMIAYFGPDRLVFQVTLYLGAFLVWSVFAVIAVASMLGRDRSEAEYQVAQQVEGCQARSQDLKRAGGLERGRSPKSQGPRRNCEDNPKGRIERCSSTAADLGARPGVVGSFSVSSATVTGSGEVGQLVFGSGPNVSSVACGKWCTESRRRSRRS